MLLALLMLLMLLVLLMVPMGPIGPMRPWYYKIDCINLFERGGKINPKGNSLLISSSKNHKQWFKYTKYLVDNPNVIEDLGNKLHETIFPQYSLKTLTDMRAEFYRELIRKS